MKFANYANSLFGYFQETAGCTEQFWCPIKHAGRIKSLHSRYQKFVDYGIAQSYRSKIEATRHDFKNLE